MYHETDVAIMPTFVRKVNYFFMKKQVKIEDDIAMPRKVNDVIAEAAKAGTWV